MRKKLLSESDFFQELKERSLGRVWFERVEPRTESGFPDTYFVVREGEHLEGTLELKWFSTRKPNLSTLMKPSQKAAFIDYDKAGGRRRYLLAAREDGLMYFYCSRDVVRAIVSGGESSASWNLFPSLPEDPEPVDTLIEMIRMFQ